MTNEKSPAFSLVQAESGVEMDLAMQRLWLRGRLLPVGARLLVQHVFQVAGSKPVEAVYAFALPRDAALRRFTIRGEKFAVHSQLRPTEDAMREYEAAIERGSLAALARQHGDGIINLTAGNLRPGELVTVSLEIIAGVESHDDGFRFRFPFTLAPGYHKRARMLEVEPGMGETELPADEFGDVLLPRFQQEPSNLHGIGFDLRIEARGEWTEVASPSHGIRVRAEDRGTRVGLARAKDVPDRDLVLEVKRPSKEAEVYAGKGIDGRKHFAAVIPSAAFMPSTMPSTRSGAQASAPRRVAFVLDRSGSMGGAPIQEARRALEACLGALEPADQFDIVAFDNDVQTFSSGLVDATRSQRDAARRFLASIDARGGTELSAAIDKAAALLNGGGDVLVITDGQVFGTERILAVARATGLRLHTLGIGSASQDRFLALLARETGGVSRFVTAQERVDLTAVDLFASIGRPVACGVQVEGALAPGFVFTGTPLIAYGESALDSLTVRWSGGALELALEDSGRHTGETVRLLRGARLLTDLDCRGETARLREVSEEYGLASREMALVAVVERIGDQPGKVPKTIVVPVGMPQDTRFDAYFAAKPPALAAPAFQMGARFSLARRSAPARVAKALFGHTPGPPPPLTPPADPLFDLASAIDDDGGLPGASVDERIRRALHAILCFVERGHSIGRGAFRAHVQRLVTFIELAGNSLAPDQRRTMDSVLNAARSGTPPPGDWARQWELGRTLDWAALPRGV